jgi:hydrogenase maturation factor
LNVLVMPPSAANLQTLPAGKLPHRFLGELLAGLPTADPQLVLGPTVGEDAAVIDFAREHDYLLVAKSDPITFATEEIGYYAVNVCANDLAVTGATPRFFLPTVLLPAGQATPALASAIFAQIGAACRALGVVVAGGHSEITPVVSQPVVSGNLLGEVRRDRFLRSGGSRPGEVVLLAGPVPVEGTSIIAREKRAALLAAGWTQDELDTAANYLFEPGISVLQPALLAADAGLVSAMHDPTEGGVATGLLELALAADVGLAIELDAIPVPDLARRLCTAFALDPLGTIASGALLATAIEADVPRLLHLWREAGWYAAVIGRVTERAEGLTAHRDGQTVPFPQFAVDEITKL